MQESASFNKQKSTDRLAYPRFTKIRLKRQSKKTDRRHLTVDVLSRHHDGHVKTYSLRFTANHDDSRLSIAVVTTEDDVKGTNALQRCHHAFNTIR